MEHLGKIISSGNNKAPVPAKAPSRFNIKFDVKGFLLFLVSMLLLGYFLLLTLYSWYSGKTVEAIVKMLFKAFN